MGINISDYDLIVALSGGGCSLNRSPKKNWVEKDGGLPNYICRIARAINRGKGHSVSSSISIAVSRAKNWAAGGSHVTAATSAKAAAAVAEWEALKAKAHAGGLVKATNQLGQNYVMLSNIPSFNVDIVRQAWDSQQRAARAAAIAAKKNSTPDADGDNDSSIVDATLAVDDAIPYSWIKELWSDFIIIQTADANGEQLYKVPYTVDSDGDSVTFADSIPVTVQYVADTDGDDDLTDEEKKLLGLDGSETFLSAPSDALDRIVALNAVRSGLRQL